MDDEGGDWFADAAEEPPKGEKKPAAPKEASKAESTPAAEAAAAPAADQRPEASLEELLDTEKLLLFKHWIRPRFLQYKYLYNYRHNYYNDVIDYLDKRQKGLSREVPRAQTWAERVLRTYNNKRTREEYFKTLAEDTKLVSHSQLSGSFFHYHSKQYVNRRYSNLLY
ncbi:hypothetical protein ILUMI_00098 [Ignelater luminosus]|uniref:Flightin n=1 Tax=Ignelater luminosus TaxID=2038154 RepID=A0A8K0DKV8_IGNLU|nr:hypothetical protein ILUMI_00098 [Ignelater luminosus]